jgi:hypothetical protein
VIAQHQLLGVGMQIHLLVHPPRHRIAIQGMLEPVRSYVRGTISGTNPCRQSSMRTRSSNLPQVGLVLTRQVILQVDETHQVLEHVYMLAPRTHHA